MENVTKEQLAEARKVDLLTYMQRYEPDNLVKSAANEYRLKEHDSLIISNGLWHWSSRGVGGRSALDFLVNVRGMHLVSAARQVLGSHGISFQPSNTPSPPKKQPEKFTLPDTEKYPNRVLSYLQQRGIHYDIIKYGLQAKIIMESKKYGNCLFVGYDEKGAARFACARGTKSNFHGDLAGSEKEYSFCLSPRPRPNKVIVCESPIDALSAATMRQMKSGHWQDYNYLSLDGTSPLALVHFLRQNPTVTSVTLALDNDKAGRSGTDRCATAIKNDPVLSKQVKQLRDLPPDRGKDYNELLQLVRRENRQQSPKEIERGEVR